MAIHHVYLINQRNGEEIVLDGDQDINWVFTIGGSPSVSSFRIGSTEDRKLRDMGIDRVGPWDLVFDVAGRAAEAVRYLWCVNRVRSHGPSEAVWAFADRRWALKNVLVSTLFNGMRPANDFNRPGVPVAPEVSVFAQAPKRHFIPEYSWDPASGDESPQFSPGTDDSYEPWTALRGLSYMVSDESWLAAHNAGGDVLTNPDGSNFSFGTVERVKATERKILLRANWNPEQHWPGAINELSREARVGLFVDQNGRFNLIDLDVANSFLQASYGRYEGSGGIPIMSLHSMSAPSRTRIHFPKYDEILWVYDEDKAEGIANNEPDDSLHKSDRPLAYGDTEFGLMNAVPLPQDVGDFKAAQDVDVFDALREWRGDTANLPRKSQVLAQDVFTRDRIQRHILTTALAHLFQRDFERVEFRNTVLEARAATVYNYYRQRFKIPDFWLDKIEDIRAERSALIATTTRRRQPSPIFMDWNSWDSTIFRHRNTGGSSQTIDEGKGYIRNMPFGVRVTKPSDENLRVTESAFNFRMADLIAAAHVPAIARVDPRRGILTYDFLPSLSGTRSRAYPGLIDPDSVPTRVVGAIQNGVHFIGKMRLRPQFRFAVVLAVKWRVRNTRDKYFIVSTPGSDFFPGAARGPIRDFNYTGFEAFRTLSEVDDAKWSVDSQTNQFIVEHSGRVGNEDILKDIANAETRRIYARHQDRVIGTFRAKGWTRQMPVGQFRETAIHFKGGAFETEVRGETDPAVPSVWEFLAPPTRNVLRRFELDTALGA